MPTLEHNGQLHVDKGWLLLKQRFEPPSVELSRILGIEWSILKHTMTLEKILQFSQSNKIFFQKTKRYSPQ